AEHDQELLLDVAYEFQDAEAVKARNESEHDQNEDETRDVERAHQLAERQQRVDPILADRESHRTKSADRPPLQDDADNREQHGRALLDHVEHERAPPAELVQTETEQDG